MQSLRNGLLMTSLYGISLNESTQENDVFVLFCLSLIRRCSFIADGRPHFFDLQH